MQSREESTETLTPSTPQGSSVRALLGLWTCFDGAQTSLKHSAWTSRRLVWCADASGRDGNVIERVLARYRPKNEADRLKMLALKNVETNVYRLYQAATQTSVEQEQIVRYFPGCGTGQRFARKVFNGITAYDWPRRLKAAVLDMSRHYHYGDEIVLIGFSRGAYMMRAFALILDRVGMVPAAQLIEGETGLELLDRALSAYHDLFSGRNQRKARTTIEHVAKKLQKARICRQGTSASGGTIVKALALFDTVCAFSLPRCLGFRGGDYIWSRLFGSDSRDDLLPANVEYAYHAISLLEDRIDYPLTRIRKPGAESHLVELKEVAFTGLHSDCGGGYLSSDVSDLACCWLAASLERACGTIFDSSLYAQIAADHSAAYAQMKPHRNTFSPSYGPEALCFIKSVPRSFFATKLFSMGAEEDELTIHSTVPERVRSQLTVKYTVAQLLPEERRLRDEWSLQEGDVGIARAKLTSRALEAWAQKIDDAL